MYLLRLSALQRKRSEGLVRTAILLLAASSAGSLFAQSAVTIGLNNAGLSSLQFNGTQFLAYGAFRLDGLTFLTPSGQLVAGDLTGTLSVNVPQQTETWLASWGTITVNFSTSGNQLRVSMTVNNQSPNIIQDLWMEPFDIQFPSTPLEWLYPLVVNSIGQPAIQQTTFSSGVMVLAASDIIKPVQLGFPWSNNPTTNTIFPLMVNTGLVNGYPTQYQAINRPIPAGGSDTVPFTLRFGPPGSTEETLAPDIYQAFAADFPMTLNWPDRRPIGALFLSTAATGWPTNPRGWLLDPTINVFTPAGIANLQTRILAYADNSIAILQSMNAQGMITWDIEGQQFPDPTSYVCDPTQFIAAAPEMAGIADAYFQKFIAAGLRVGVCIRPQQFVLSADGTSAAQNYVADPTQLLMDKVAYAMNRWGATMFYVDSNVDLTDPNPIPASIFQKLTAAFPTALFLPEHSDMQYYAYTAPYKQLNQGNTSTTPDVRMAYPTSFTVIYTADGPITQDFNALVTAVSAGDALLFRGWYPDPQNAQDLSIYQEAAQSSSHVPPTVTFINPANGSTVSGAVTLSATAAANGTATIASVQFKVDGNSLGTDATAPYALQLATTTLTNGSHTLSAVAQDSLGNTGSASITVTVSNVVPPPTVTFISPANGSTVSGAITLSATAAANSTATIASVQFKADGNNLGSVAAAPYSIQINTTALTNGSHTLTAVAQDSLGNMGSASVTVTVSNVVPPPTVTFMSPANGSTVSGAITLSATAAASGTATIASVQFKVDGNSLGTDATAPYSVQLATTALTNGSHTLTAVAQDSLGNTGSASITVTVSNVVPPPTVTFISPANGGTVTGAITLSATAAASATATIANVQFKVDGNSLGTVVTAPYSILLTTVTLTNGSHTLTAMAQDSLGNTGSASITVTVSNAPTNGGTGSKFSYQSSITIAHGQVPNTDQTNFPVLIEGVYPYLATAAYGGQVQNANGCDIIFTSDSAGANLLNWELESYNPATGAVAIWVQIPTVSHTADTVLYMSYGSASISAFQGNKNGTWSANYTAVYHMDDDAANPSVADSTSNGNTGSAAANTNLKTTQGEIGRALGFNGINDAIGAGGGSSFGITGAITLQAWINVNSMPSLGNQSYILGKGYNGTNEAYFLRLETNTSGTSYVEAGTFSFPNSYQAQAVASGFSGGWHYVVGTYNGVWNIYVDGVKTTSTQTQAPFSSPSEQFAIGAQDSTSTMKNYLNGAIDEVRVSNIARSSDWISTEYANQSQPSTFYTIGAVQASNVAVAFITPANGSTVSNTVSVSASASSSAAVVNVQFKVDGNNLGTVATAPYSVQLNTTTLTNGSHTLTAVAQDTLGNTGSASITVTVSNAVPPPTVTFITPANGSTVSGAVTLSATAAANGTATIASVQFKVDGNSLGTDATAPYSIQLNTTTLTNGTHTLTAVAQDSLGNAGSASITVTVSNVVPPPTVTFISPANGSTVSGAITLSATAAANGTATIASVQFKMDGNSLGSIAAAPYSILLTTTMLTNGSHTLTAVAQDSLGNTGSASVTVTVSNVVPLPTVTFISPASGSTVSGAITLSATAAASGTATIANVQFKVDGNSLGTVVTAPYSILLSTATLTNGSHTLTAVAQDSLGNTGSASITVTVSNAPTNGGTGSKFSYQSSITIAHGQVPNTDQTNFPVLIEGVYPYLATAAYGGQVQNANGYDIIFTSDSAGANLLNWELESYNPATGAVAIWVQIPTVSHTADTVLYMSYGSASISAFQGNKNGTWSANYTAVYHMDDDAANPSVADSTSNGNTGSAAANTNLKTTQGEIGRALGFNGINDAIGAGGGSSFGITGAITLQAWINVNSMPSLGNQSYILGKGYNGTNEAYFLRLETNTSGTSYVEAGTFSFPNSYQAQAVASGFSGGWHYVVGTYNGVWNIYVDGVKTTSTQTQAPFSSPSEQFAIGAQDSTSTMKNYLNGAIDEVRVSNIARSSDWISTEYANQSQPSTFYTIGAPQPASN